MLYSQPVTITVLPAPPGPASPYKQYLTHDHASRGNSPNSSFWNERLQAWWRRKNSRGNWTGANGATEGAATPFHTTMFSGDGAIGTIKAIDVSGVVQKYLDTGKSKGFYLAAAGTSWEVSFHGRLAANVADRPTLTVVTNEGTYSDLPCIATAWWRSNSALSSDGFTVFAMQNGVSQAIVLFDLSQVKGTTIVSATLNLKVNNAKAGQSYTIQVYEADPPLMHIAGTGTPQTGIAASFAKDKGLFGGHPDVLNARDFSGATSGSYSPWATNDHSAGHVPNTSHDASASDRARVTYTYDAETDSWEYNNTKLPSEFNLTVGRWITEDAHANNVLNGIRTAPTHNVLNFRYYLKVVDPFQAGDTMKWAGFDARWGRCTNPDSSSYAVVSGNGGSPGDGKVHVNGSGQYEFWGHSIRGHLGAPSAADHGHPYDKLVRLGNYVYHVDQGNQYGDHLGWGYAEGDPKVGLKCAGTLASLPHVTTVMPLDQWVCIEQRITMNTVFGPVDAMGNHEGANFDGKLEAWIDGVKCGEKNDYRWTHHPNYGVQGAWFETYHGGSAPWPAASAPGAFKVNHIVQTRNGTYIGPRAK